MSTRHYTYVGPDHIKEQAQRASHCIQVTSAKDVVAWSANYLSSGRANGLVPATFIIDTLHRLWIADRRSEHVACADGGDVLAAGEMLFERSPRDIEVVEATNQSTGYCPEPECWPIVAQVLDGLGIPRPGSFTPAFHFRRCDQCRTTNLIKDDIYECAVCATPLSQIWNFA